MVGILFLLNNDAIYPVFLLKHCEALEFAGSSNKNHWINVKLFHAVYHKKEIPIVLHRIQLKSYTTWPYCHIINIGNREASKSRQENTGCTG